ncbi:uncharacterized protein N7459_004421 [Penicillium hispanicum]|uniref:uncharacterized protein n=1 Tax=Penicillium hispanicum TaxID=1080232 RepID=UPI00253FAD12|nr:uncharacterized protein N7459_004421 [Penicillium hispanicum]KAJ5584621.1 hypothetical protein N7459_004421 [Penicillium hispanicum]
MSTNTARSVASAGSESAASLRQRSSLARAERSASNPASFVPLDHYDTALPPISFQPPIAHRRTGSTLKTVMRRIFNRKRQSAADGVDENPHESFYTSAPVRLSGPAEGKSLLAIPTPADSKRSSPLSEKNLQLQLAGTHLSPTALSGGSPASPGLTARRRRATLPSVVFSDDESRYAVASSAISDPQDDRSIVPDQSRRISPVQDRRRSRSIDALRDLAEQQDSASWPLRATSIPTSGPGSKSPPLEGSSASGPSRPSTGTTVTSVTRVSAAPSLVESDQQAEQISLPPNVGNLVHTMQQDDGLTLEQRLNTLEVKMIDLEFAIARMQSNSVESGSIERPSRPKQPPSNDSFPNHSRNKPSTGYLGSADRDESPSPLPSFPAGRPTSTSTIRPETINTRTLRTAPSATSLSDFSGVSIEQYSTLVTLLRREQTARRNLESQVSSLRDDIRHIQRAALHSMESGTMYPIHTVDSQEFLRFRRALDDSDDSSPIRPAEERQNGAFDSDSDWDRPDHHSRDDPFGPPKWEHGQRIVAAPMI